jgi:hypothetical protein
VRRYTSFCITPMVNFLVIEIEYSVVIGILTDACVARSCMLCFDQTCTQERVGSFYGVRET